MADITDDLNFKLTQRGDNKLLTLADNDTDWSNATGTVTKALLTITVCTEYEDPVVYDDYEYEENDEVASFTGTAPSVVFTDIELDSADIGMSADEEFPDGIYAITLAITTSGSDTGTWTSKKLIVGQVEFEIEDDLRTVAKQSAYWTDDLTDDDKELMSKYLKLKSISSAAYVGLEEEIMACLENLTNLTT